MKKKTKNQKLSELLNKTRPTVHLNITDDKEESNKEHPVSGSNFKNKSVRMWDKWWVNGANTATIEALGTRLNGLTAYKTVVNGVERVVDLKNMDEAIEFVNLLLDMGENGGK